MIMVIIHLKMMVDYWAKNKCYSISNTDELVCCVHVEKIVECTKRFCPPCLAYFIKCYILCCSLSGFFLFYCACRSYGVLNQVGSFCCIISGK